MAAALGCALMLAQRRPMRPPPAQLRLWLGAPPAPESSQVQGLELLQLAVADASPSCALPVRPGSSRSWRAAAAFPACNHIVLTVGIHQASTKLGPQRMGLAVPQRTHARHFCQQRKASSPRGSRIHACSAGTGADSHLLPAATSSR